MKPQLRERRSLDRYGQVLLTDPPMKHLFLQGSGSAEQSSPLIQHQPGQASHLGGTQFMAHTRNTRVCLFPVSCFPSMSREMTKPNQTR